MNHNGNVFAWGVLISSVVSVVSFPAVIMAQNPPTLEQQRAQDAESARQAQSERPVERRYDDRDRPGELYVAGFGGYTIGHGFDNVEGTGALSGINLGDIDLKDSGVYGAKVGYFMPGD